VTELQRAKQRPLDLEVFIAASPPTVWQFWVDPERMCEWWGIKAELDPHPGGIYRVTMGDDGPVMSGAYVELEPYERLVFLFGWEDGRHSMAPSSTRVEVTLTPEGHGTRVILRHLELPTTEAIDQHQQGWVHFLGELARVVVPAAGHGASAPEAGA
jgi:uncharacterized protein YndB with AHSA1/START domain